MLQFINLEYFYAWKKAVFCEEEISCNDKSLISALLEGENYVISTLSFMNLNNYFTCNDCGCVGCGCCCEILPYDPDRLECKELGEFHYVKEDYLLNAICIYAYYFLKSNDEKDDYRYMHNCFTYLKNNGFIRV